MATMDGGFCLSLYDLLLGAMAFQEQRSLMVVANITRRIAMYLQLIPIQYNRNITEIVLQRLGKA